MTPLFLALIASAQPAQTQPDPGATAADLPLYEASEHAVPASDGAAGDRAQVAGGTPVPADEARWDGTLGVVVNNRYIGCTATLVAPRVALTAAHCLGGVTGVMVGAKNWATDSDADHVEILPVDLAMPHPSYRSGGADIAVLRLAEPSSYEPRVIATDCVRDEHLVDGAEVAVVGFGATNYNGGGQTTRLHYGFTVIQDAECRADRVNGVWTGCRPSLRPGGELGAGGTGVDACFGDSGGPLYLTVDDGDYLAGVVSRAYAGVPEREPCRYGGIYLRPDAYIDWIEETTGLQVRHPQCNLAPVASIDPLVTRRNTKGTQQILAIDPDGDVEDLTYELVTLPENGRAAINGDGVVTYIPNDGFSGSDELIVGVVDAGSAVYERSGPRRTELVVPVEVERRFLGCASLAAPALPVTALFGLLLLVRRRRV